MTYPIVEKLRRAAENASRIHRDIAEAKSLRQEGNSEGRTDLYMWPTPEQTLEGKAAAHIQALAYALARLAEEVADETTSEEMLREIGYPATYAKAVTIARAALSNLREGGGQ